MSRIQRSSEKKIINRSVQQPVNPQRKNIEKVPSVNASSVTNSKNIASFNQEKSNISQERQNIFANERQKFETQKSIFYSELKIQTNDKDVPLVRILKVNQELQNKFIYYSTVIEKLSKVLKIRTLNCGFNAMTNSLLKHERNQLKIRKCVSLLNKIKNSRLQVGLLKLFTQKHKSKIKQKALIVINRLVQIKMLNNFRFFFKNFEGKRLMKIMLEKAEEDQTTKLKLNLEVFKKITFSKEFIAKCRPLIKYNASNKSWFQNELNRQHFQQNLKVQLQRYQKIRQNVDNLNPNTQQATKNKKTLVKRKSTLTDTELYQNEVVLMAIKSFLLSRVDTQSFYEGKLFELHQKMAFLQTQQRYTELEALLKEVDGNNRSYESLINQFYSKSDEQIRKIVNQINQTKNVFHQQRLYKQRLLPILLSQRNKYQKMYEKYEKQSSLTNKTTKDNKQLKRIDEYLSKLYQTRCFNLSLSIMLISDEGKQKKMNFEQLYGFLIENLNDIVGIYNNETKLKQNMERLRKLKSTEEQYNGSIILINVSECFQELNDKLKGLQNEKKSYVSKGQQQSISNIADLKIKEQIQNKKSIQKIERQTSANKKSSQESAKKPPASQEIAKRIIPEQSSKKSINSLLSSATQVKVEGAEQNLNQIYGLISSCIIQYFSVVNNAYENEQKIPVENVFLKKNLLPQTKGRTSLQKNIEINQFLNQLNQEIVKLASHLQHSLVFSKKLQDQHTQLISMIYLFYEVILIQSPNSSSTQKEQTVKFNELTKKWQSLCKKINNSSSNSSKYQQSTGLINVFNELIMVYKQLTQNANKSKQPEEDFVQQLKKILKEKLEYERQYHESEKRFLLRDEEYKIVEKQNKGYQSKVNELQKQLTKLRNQSKLYNQKHERNQNTIKTLKEELDVYVSTAKTESQENNRLTREINKFKSSITILTQEVQRYKTRDRQKTRATSKEKVTKKTTYTLKQFTQMENDFNVKIKEYQQNIQHLQNQKVDFSKQILDLKGQLKDSQRHIEEATFDVKRLNQEIERLKQQNRQWISIQEMYQSQIQKFRMERTQHEQSIANLKSELQKLRATQNNKQSSVHSQAIILLNSQIEQFNSQIQSLQKQSFQNLQKISSLRYQLQVKQDKIVSLQELFRLKENQWKVRQDSERKQYKQMYESDILKQELRFKNQQGKYLQRIRQMQLKLLKSPQIVHEGDTIIIEKQINKFDPQKQIESLKGYVETLQKENGNLQLKYKQLKKQHFSDDNSTTVSTKSNTANRQSISWYESIVHELKIENDRLYTKIFQLTKLKSSNSLSLQEETYLQVEQANIEQFWLKQIVLKQSHFIQKEKEVELLKEELALMRQEKEKMNCLEGISFSSKQLRPQEASLLLELEQKILFLKIQYERKQTEFNRRVQFEDLERNRLANENSELKLKLKEFMKDSYLKSQNYVTLNYTELLVSTKQVKELFTNFIQATNRILSKLDQTSQIYLQPFPSRLSEPPLSEYSQAPYQSILSLIQEFKTVIENNHESLKTIYQNLVCHPYTKSALQLQYLKELSFNIVKAFSQQITQTSVFAKEFLLQQIERLFTFTERQSDKVKPIQQIFVNVEEFVIMKLDHKLTKYKKQLHIKALELDYLREKFNIIVDKELIEQAVLVSKYPREGSPQTKYTVNTKCKIHHNYQYKGYSNHVPYELNQSNSKPSRGDQNRNNPNRRPSSGPFVSKVADNYAYRPMTYLDTRYQQKEQVYKQRQNGNLFCDFKDRLRVFDQKDRFSESYD